MVSNPAKIKWASCICLKRYFGDILTNSDRKLNLLNRFLIKFGVDFISIN